jgi:GWxTD domain-containing protein
MTPSRGREAATRSLERARRGFVWGAVLLLAVAGGRAATAAEALGPLPWRVAAAVGFTVDTAAFPDSAGISLEVYVRVPPVTLGSLVREPDGQRRLRLTARLKGAYGGTQQSAVEDIAIAPTDTAAGFGKVIVLKFRTRPGAQHLRVRLEDRNSQKRGLLYAGRKVAEAGEVEGEFEIPSPQQGRSLSSIEFAWADDSSAAPGVFARAGRFVVPNPERLFGLHANDLIAYFLARSPDGSRPWSWRAQIVDPGGRLVAVRETTLAAGPVIEDRFTADLTREPEGGYDLEVRAWQEGDRDTLVQRSHWSLAWKPESWFRNPRVLEDHMHFLLTGDAEESFVLLHPGEQEQFLEAFWRERDPSEGTARNEAREEFLRRVDLANRAYGRSAGMPGMFSDMGRVFVRYGEPSEVLKQVVPSGDNTLERVLRELQVSEDRDVGEVHQKGLGGDMRPYEVWVYEGDIPLPPDADPRLERNTRRKRLVFLFVDDQGIGDYRLRYSTE